MDLINVLLAQGYTDEPISKILSNIADSDTILLDRWSLNVTPNPDAAGQHDDGKDNLPLNVVNNYFSFGVDAHIALEFHEARGKCGGAPDCQLGNRILIVIFLCRGSPGKV